MFLDLKFPLLKCITRLAEQPLIYELGVSKTTVTCTENFLYFTVIFPVNPPFTLGCYFNVKYYST